MNQYLPEGLALSRQGYTQEELLRAKQTGAVLQAPAVVCTRDHDLLVDLGCCLGRIPHRETAIGISQGTTREIAVLSRVGRPVSFRVLDLLPDGSALLSRRLAQEEARARLFETHVPGDVIPAVITSLAGFGAFCDVGCGLPALLGIAAISVSRIRHSRDRFSEDQEIRAVIRAMDENTGRIQLSHRELLGTWEENAAQFHSGETVTGIVRSVQDYGAFIELTPNLSGLAEPNPELREGDAVSVYIKSILPDSLKIKLVALRKLDPAALPRRPLEYRITQGHLDRWYYSTQQPEKAATVF